MAHGGKPNTTRLLDAAGIAYSLVTYEVDESLDASAVAAKLGADPERVFKTLVTRGDKTGIEVFCVPGDGELDLKQAALLTGNKRIEMVRADELLGLTGYIRGGCSPIGLKKPYRIHFDESVVLFDTVFVSAGLRGFQLAINGEELAGYVDATLADLTK